MNATIEFVRAANDLAEVAHALLEKADKGLAYAAELQALREADRRYDNAPVPEPEKMANPAKRFFKIVVRFSGGGEMCFVIPGNERTEEILILTFVDPTDTWVFHDSNRPGKLVLIKNKIDAFSVVEIPSLEN